MSSLFVRKPRLAFTLSILFIVAGLISFSHIPTALLPSINKPEVRITASYPSASPTTLESAFLEPAEEALNGVKDMDYIKSFVTNSGFAMIKVIFKAGSNPDKDAINVQNRLASATSSMPKAIQARGISIRATSSTQLMVISLYSSDNKLSPTQLSAYANRFLTKPLSRVNGVSNVGVSNTMAVHITLNMEKMQALNITPREIIQAIREQNQSSAVGSIGQAPSPSHPAFTFAIETDSLLHSKKQLQHIILKATPNRGIVYLNEVATISVAPEDANLSNATLNGQPTTFISIYQRPNANTLDVASDVRSELSLLSTKLPDNIKAKIIIDTSQFIQVSIHEVFKTLIEAIILVILIVFLFLQNWRATLVPAVTIPVALIGTLTFMYAFGYSINTISLFALVLSIGIVVDDAIIVIENVERHISVHKLSPRTATTKAMKEITAPILVTTCVLLSVFFAVAFLPGIQGKIFQQFSVVLCIAIAISAIVSLTLSPALCATLLTPSDHTPRWMHPVSKMINLLTLGYAASVTRLLPRKRWVIGLLMVILSGSFIMLKQLPSGLIPDEDQGFLEIYMQLPQSLSTSKTDTLSREISDIIQKQPGVKNVAIIPSNGTDGNGISGFIQLTPWSERASSSLGSRAITHTLQSKLSNIPNSNVFIYSPPLIHDGSMGSLDLKIQSTAGQPIDALATTASEFVQEAKNLPQIGTIFSNFNANTPSFKLLINRNKAAALGAPINDINTSLSVLSPMLISRLHKNNQLYDIQLQAAYPFRESPENLNNFYLKNDRNEMISLASFTSLKQTNSAPWITHYNLYRAADIHGRAAPGYSTNDAIIALEKLTQSLPSGYTYTWAGHTLEQINAAKALPWLFALAITFIYLFLVALYESWSIPFSVLIIVPVALSGACIALLYFGMNNNIYSQIGMLLLIGMTAKSTILMTEFAIKARGAGQSIKEAAYSASQLRFRPVIMTSLSFTLGVIPLLYATGPGANSRLYLGVTITAGMIAATLIGMLATPSAYAITQTIREKLRGEKAAMLPDKH